MNLTANSLKNPAGVAVVAIAVIVCFGAFSLDKLPVQLFPDIENPRITIQTGWRAASPREVESEIIEPIEAVLRGPSRTQGDGRLRQCRQRLDQPGVRPGHGHAADPDGGDRPHEPGWIPCPGTPPSR